MILFRGLWLSPQEVKQLESNVPILPAGVSSVGELEILVASATVNFGSLRLAALHHLTGACGNRANYHGKPVFSFWTRNRLIALEHVRNTFGRYKDKTISVLIRAEIGQNERIVIAESEGLYQEKISDGSDDTFQDFACEDEVFVSIPVMTYTFSLLEPIR